MFKSRFTDKFSLLNILRNSFSKQFPEWLYKSRGSNFENQRPWTTLVQMSLSWFLECIAVLMLQIATVFGRASTRLRYSRSPGREGPNRSGTGASKWRSWWLSFVAEVTNKDHATQERCGRIFLHQWWILPPFSVHSANVAGGPRWHHIIDCCSSQADLPRTPVPTSWLHQSSKSLWWHAAASTGKNMNGKSLSRDPAWSADYQNELQGWTPWLKNERRQITAGAPQCQLWPAAVVIQSISLVSSLRSSWVCCSSSMLKFSPCSWQRVRVYNKLING